MRRTWKAWWPGLVLVVAVLVAYSNHWSNTFQFDDAHTVVGNPAIRDLGNAPRFFTDARTATPNPENQIYRPLVTLSLAVDYAIAGGLEPFWFHLSTFVWFGVLLATLFAWLRRVVEPVVALGAVAWFALHPVAAETINYVYQRGDLYATLGVVGGLCVYVRSPRLRRYGLYLVPVVLGLLAKQSALVFAPLLWLYLVVIEQEPWRRATWRALPAGVVCAAYFAFQATMTASTWTPGGTSRVHYWLTQPRVLLHYVASFLLPVELSADTDRGLVTSAVSTPVVVGVGFLGGLALVIWRTRRTAELRPIAFGLLWFLVANAPTSLVAFAEVENDHRMFMPFVGLTLAGATALHVGYRRLARRYPQRWFNDGARVAVVAALGAYGAGTIARNQVWRTGESLWADVVQKSPRNGRGHMNYAVALLARGAHAEALTELEAARGLAPRYYLVHVNLGIVHGELGHAEEADASFRAAMALQPDRMESHFYYGRWLVEAGRPRDAIRELRRTLELQPDYEPARRLLAEARRASAAHR